MRYNKFDIIKWELHITGLTFSSVVDGFMIVNFREFKSKLWQILEVCTCAFSNLRSSSIELNANPE